MTRRRSARVSNAPSGATPALIRWGAVVGGGVIGLSVLVLLWTLWLALAVSTGVQVVEANLDWLLAGSTVVALLVGGLLAGWLSGVPGFAPGLFNGITVWAVVVFVALSVVTPGVLQTIGVPPTGEAIGELAAQGDGLWAGFVALLIGAFAAGLGGGLGGVLTRPAFVYSAPTAGDVNAPRSHVASEPAEREAVAVDR